MVKKLIVWGGILALLASCPIQAADLTWTNGDGLFSDGLNWDTRTPPIDGDDTIFTNDTSYTITFNSNSPLLVTNIFAGHAGTVTVDIGTFTWTTTDRMRIGSGGTTTTVYLAGGTMSVDNFGTAQLRIADGTNAVGKLVITNGAVLAATVNIASSAFGSGTLVVSDAGIITNSTVNGTLTVGSSGSDSQLIITNGGQVFVSGETRVGNSNTTNNFLLVSGPNSILSNRVYGIRVGAQSGRGNLLIVTNGGKVFMNDGTIGGNGQGTAFNTGIVVGVGSVYSSAGNVTLAPSSGGSTNNNLTVYDGATLICGGSITIGNANDYSGISNSVLMGGSGLMSTGSSAVVRFGSSTLLNRFVLTNAFFTSGTVAFQGISNTISVLANSQWIMTTNLATPSSALGAILTIDGGYVSNQAGIVMGGISGSQLIVTNGGGLVSNYGTIGAGAAFCTGVVAGAGSVWSNTGPNILIGTGVGGSNNALAVVNGATLFNSATLSIGNSLTANVNSVCFGGVGLPSTVINNGSLDVGGSDGSYSNKLTVTNAVLNCGTINVGVSGSTNNLLELKNGTILVGFIRVRPTNTFLFTAGTLNTGGSTVDTLANNGRPMVVGDGTSAAYLELAAGGTGFHDFNTGGLVITNNATLRGNGTLMGNVTVLGTWSPGLSVGLITVSNNLVFGSSAIVDYELGTTNDSTEVSGNLTLNGTLNVTGTNGSGVGTYTLFTYAGALSDNGLTIGATPDSGLDYLIDTNTAGQVNLDVIIPPPPEASFSGNPTSGAGPLTVTFTDNSIGTITNRFWDFGDGHTTNTTETSFNYTYTAVGSYDVSLTVYGRGGSDTNTQTGYITVMNPPHLVVEPGSLDFGSVTIGETNSLTFSVINTGEMSLEGTATVAAPFEITNGGSFSVAAGQTQTVTVAFLPTAEGSFNGSVVFSSNGGDSTNTVSGTGLTAGSISVTPATYSFGALLTGTTAQVTFVVTNSGGTAVSNGTTVASGPFSVISNATFSVPPFSATNVVVEFAPLDEGTFTNDVVFGTDNGGARTNTVAGVGAIVAVAAFSGNPTAGTAPLTVTFTNASSGSITNSFWDFGDGHTTNSTAATLNHTYNLAGTNTVILTVFGMLGTNTQTLTDYIVATNPPPPTAVFSGAPTNGTVPLAVTFTNASSGNITNALWNFSDGHTSNTLASTLVYTYNTAGTSTVSLVVSGLGGTNASTQTDYIVAINPAHLVVNPGSLSFGSITIGLSNTLSFSIINAGDAPLSGTAVATAPFTLASGGTYDNLLNGQTQIVTVTFVPVAAGASTGSVVFASNGGDSTNTVIGNGLTPGNIVVTPAQIDFGALATGTTVQASFVVTNTGGTAVSNGTATVLGGPFTIVTGASFSVPGLGMTNVTVQFAPDNIGAFTNKVAFATDNGGAATNPVIGVGAIVPVASFSGAPTNGVTPLVVTFTDSSTGTVTNRYWNFGDGNTTNTSATSVNHTYNVAGSNTVTLTVTGPLGTNIQMQASYIVAYDPPVARFSANPTTGAAALTVTFSDTSTGTITNRFWDFGDKHTTNTLVTSFGHTYDDPGTNTVSLTVFGMGGWSTTNRFNYIIVTNFVPDTTAPQLQVDVPTDYEGFTNANITVSGSASDESGISAVTLNGSPASRADTNWSQSATLSLGTNTFLVIATDASPNLNTATQTVHAVLLPNHPPQITAGLWVTNALLSVTNTSLVMVDATNIFTVTASDSDGNLLSYHWDFGDGRSGNSSVDTVGHIYTNDCGPYSASVTVSDGQVSTNSDRTVIVACQMEITKLLAKVNFKKTNADSCNLVAKIALPTDFATDGKSVSVDIGGADSSFTLNTKGKGLNAQGNCLLKFNKKTGLWKATVNLRKANLQDFWADEGLINTTTGKTGIYVTVTSALLVNDEGFAADRTLRYKANFGKTGTAK